MQAPPADGVRAVLGAAGIVEPFALIPLPGGKNNRVYRVESAGPPVVLKAYFHDPSDPRDRLATEHRFSRFLWDRGLRCVPEPLAAYPPAHLGIYEHVAGRRLDAPTDDAVAQAAEFFRALNRHRSHAEAAALPPASEACFSGAEHVACVDRRMAALRAVDDPDAATFVRDELLPGWARVRAALGGVPDAPSDRCLSPSDFGFHNALVEASGRIRFLDLEYAGWDDPAKAACDFFCQPDLPVPERFLDPMLAAFAEAAEDPAAFRERVMALLPLYRVKWCCILLNEFLPAGGRRRAYAGADAASRRPAQLAKARAELARAFTRRR